ncbi:polyadenylate-binding protein-interacting protein 4 isoform X2 [Lactuca sativa]|uniref:polyadenylate-binding protein-interacting protein 4 isoform X2 n=1 Tax=Lactuca sativa TaxID=4236 RepID=UPI000CD98802|nr:polyadenylate-binding protein-interacting protein 4 isoform X2 [Lactuca sativa]
MNLQQVAPPRSSANGFNRRRGEKEMGIRFDNKSQSGKSNFNKTITTGLPIGNKGVVDNPSRERLVYFTTCLIGHQVDVQVTDGSVYSGIFHATNADSDFGIILKMACVTNTGSSQGQKNISDSVNKAPSKTLIIPAKDFVQVVAKGVTVTSDGLTNEVHLEKQQDIMTDSLISRSRHVDLERELEPWVPDDDNIELPELDNTFDRHWNRGWDQFETNAALFGVKSTFNEELYTTKLDRGPQMRELEKQALRIAREIEGEDTQDLHLAEERGIHFHSSFDLDEETKYSSVFRGVDDSGYDENEDIWDTENNETFGNVSDSIINNQLTHLKSGGSQAPSLVEGQASQTSTSRDFYPSSSLHNESRIQENQNQSSQQKAGSYYTKEKEDTGKHMQFLEQNEASKPEVGKKESSEKGLSADATAYAPSNNNKPHETVSCSEATVKTHEEATTTTTTQSLSSTSESGNAAPVSSPTSSMASEKSTLNPNAKEFRLNPNAKSFVPLQTPVRPPSPSPSPVAHAPEHSFYYPPPVSHMQPPVMYGPQTTSYQPQQPYFNPNVPQYGQQMVLGQPRQMVYMPTYPPEMQYKGRDF